MTTGSVSSVPGPGYYTGYTKTWSGLDSPTKDSWNPYAMEQTATTVVPGYSNEHRMNGTGFGNPVWTDDSELRLLDKLSEKARRHEFNAGVFLGQTGEVASSVVGTLRALRGMNLALRRGDLRGAMRFMARSVSGADQKAAKKKLSTRDIAGTHLSLVYGWLPLLSDVHAAAEALEVLANPPRSSSFRVKRSQTVDTIDGSQSPSLYTCPVDSMLSKEYYVTLIEELSAPRSLGLLDPLSIAWELTPYSFVVDWFVPIGTYLSNLATIPYLSGTVGSATFLRQRYRCAQVSGSYDYGAASGQRVKVLRGVQGAVSELKLPLPVFRGFDQLYNNSARTANAIALTRNLFR